MELVMVGVLATLYLLATALDESTERPGIPPIEWPWSQPTDIGQRQQIETARRELGMHPRWPQHLTDDEKAAWPGWDR